MEVAFSGTMRDSNYCVCDYCGEMGKVLNLKIPNTKYFGKTEQSTVYEFKWICRKCTNKLESVLKENNNF